MLKILDPLSAFAPRFLRSLVGLRARPDLGCIIRPGGLGDLVILTMASLRNNIDVWRIVWVVERRNKSWCELLKMPFIAYDEFAGIRLAAKSREGFAWVVDSEQTFGLSGLFACRLTPADGKIIGFQTSRAAHLFDITVDHPLSQQHEIETFSQLLNAADKVVSLPKREDVPPWEPHELACAKGSYVVLALGGRQAHDRALDISVWVKLAALARQYSDEIYIVGHPADTKFGVELLVNAPWIKFNYVGRVTFTEVARLIKGAARVVGIDSGLIQVASFFGTAATALFVNQQKKERWAPLAEGSVCLMPGDLP
jgi:ADP-heptose:LPS heptosyltransferase